ncbi:sulfate [Escherichia coli]|uniref:Sulfate n=1 Tax=Escherichia coli TaxID=562 RepID=A0A377C8F7_ECOLX|nr:sulfate [Escherichia coli]
MKKRQKRLAQRAGRVSGKVVLPELSPALVAGVALSFTRSLGEFGAVIFIAGNIAWKTEVTSLMIFGALAGV